MNQALFTHGVQVFADRPFRNWVARWQRFLSRDQGRTRQAGEDFLTTPSARPLVEVCLFMVRLALPPMFIVGFAALLQHCKVLKPGIQRTDLRELLAELKQ
jgi:hypothetical protein